MKLRHGIAIGCITALLGLGAFAGVASNVKPVEKAEATTAKTIYVDIDLNTKFKESGANPWLRYYNGSNHYVQLVHVANNIYRTNETIPANVLTNASYGFECYCFNSAEKGNDCTTSWISGNGLLQHDNYNYVCIAGYNYGQQNQIKGFGYYNATENNGQATPSTQRVWVINNNDHGFYNNDDWGAPCKNGLGYLDSSSNWHMIVMSSVQDARDSNEYYYYADIPTDVTAFHVVRLSQGTNHNHLYYTDAYSSSIVSGKVYYVGTYSYDDANNLTVSDDGKDASSNVLGKVVEAYYTCKTTGQNGCTAANIKNLKDTWFNRTTATDLATATINDYANGDTSYSGSRSRTVTIANKWSSMQSVSAGGKPSGLALPGEAVASNSTSIVAVGAIAVSMIGLSGFFLLKKKKEL